ERTPIACESSKQNSNPYSKIPLDYQYGAKIVVAGKNNYRQRSIPDIDYDMYMSMRENRRRIFRHLYYDVFERRKYTSELFNPKNVKLPLKSEKNMDEFIKTAQIYLRYKDQPIICLGRSPKWFLDAAKWMKDGISGYKFVAFSGNWFSLDKVEGVRYIDSMRPSEKEEIAYQRYLESIKADPASIVENYKKTGIKTVITDFIFTSRGISSFLDLMGRFAKKQGVIEDFVNSFEVVAIGSTDYIERTLLAHDEDASLIPELIIPPSLKEHARNLPPESLFRPYKIPYKFYNMYYPMFMEMLINENTNECRSSYYPHTAWTIYRPDRFKTGLIRDMSKVKALLETTDISHKNVSDFSLPMADYRNLLNFRILDALNARGLLKVIR
ncbi:hypothetical protein IJ596_07580, partial [bacterium]|nr:hypothetical protein [bacterium]